MSAIWLASYPKSGNTWTRLALYALRHGSARDVVAALGAFGTNHFTYDRFDRALGAESSNLTRAEIDALRPDFNAALFGEGEPRLAKTHDAWSQSEDGRAIFDPAITCATLYLLRDPRDIAISWARFMGWGIDAAIDMLGNPEMELDAQRHRRTIQLPQRLTSWREHVIGWIDASGLDPLVIRYEDMLADPGGALTRMAARIGWAADAEAIADAIQATRFDRLAEQEKRHGFLERAENTPSFFRAGTSGQWRTGLTRPQIARIERDQGDVMARFGYL